MPKDVLANAHDPEFPAGRNDGLQVGADPGLWIGLNLLVCGPPGSGKLSFVRALSEASDATAQLCVYDFETEIATQEELIHQLLASLEDSCSSGRGGCPVVHIMRHLHRLKGPVLAEFARQAGMIMQRVIDDAGPGRTMRLHATSYEGARWPKAVRETFHFIFPCWIRLSDGCTSQRDLGRFLKHVLVDLNRRYGRSVTEVEAEVIGSLRHFARGRSLHELRNMIERAYVASPGRRLRASALSPTM